MNRLAQYYAPPAALGTKQNPIVITLRDTQMVDLIELKPPKPDDETVLVKGGQGRRGDELTGPDSWMMLLIYALICAGVWQVCSWLYIGVGVVVAWALKL